MGSVGLGTNASLGAFQNKLYPEGLDLGRCQIKSALGTFVADPASTFRAGMAVMRNSAGLVVASDGTDFLGVAKWNHTSSVYSVAVDEAIALPGTTTVSLKNALISNVRVCGAVLGGTPFTVTTDYTISATNGTVTRVGAGAIVDGATVYVTYTFQIPEATLLTMQGKNFWNTMDEVAMQDYRCTVITDSDIIFTSQYVTSDVWALTSTGSSVYAATGGGLGGLFTTSSSGSAKLVGRVFQVPTAADPYLGIRVTKAVI